jgi:hypothetical protein
MSLPSGWNRTRATAVLLALALHLAAAWWLLAMRFESPDQFADGLKALSMPRPQAPPPPPPVDHEFPPPRLALTTAAPLPLPVPDILPPSVPDWSGTARDVARDMTAEPSYRRFGEVPKGPEQPPKERYPRSIFEQPLPRVGKTVTTPEGETIIWVSDHCYVSISSRSLTQGEIHAARKGVRTCSIPLGRKEARGDLFDPIKRPPPPQEPGCDKEGVGQSCGR